MEKKNTVLLTVIAIATLLVAVVGATFAYFASASDSSATATITTETAKAVDLFKATSQVSLDLNVTNDIMHLGNATKTNATDTDNIVVELTAGSGEAVCSYDLVWTPTTGEGYYTYSPSKDGETTAVNEYTLAITNADSYVTTDVDKLPQVLANDLEIKTTTSTSVTHAVTATFYNLDMNQNDQIDKKFGGVISVEDVHCTNGDVITYSERTGA